MASSFWCGYAAGAGGRYFYAGNGVSLGTTTSGIGTVGGRVCIDTTLTGAMAISDLDPGSEPTFGANDFYLYSFGLRCTGTLPSAGVADDAVILHGGAGTTARLGIEAINSTTFKISLTNDSAGILISGTTVLSVDTWYDIRISADVAGDTWTVWVDATKEIDAYSRTVQTGDFNTDIRFTLQPATTAGGTFLFSCGVLCVGTAVSERPQRNPTGHFLYPNGDNDSTTYGDDTINCNDGAGTYTLWDEWGTAATEQDGAGTAMYECGGNAGKEISTLSTATIDTALTIRGGIMCTSAAASTGSKTVDSYHIFKDTVSTTEVEYQVDNLATTAFEARKTSWRTPPSGVWTDYVNGTTFNHASAAKRLAAGVRSPSTNGANDIHSALGVEIFLWADDAPPKSLVIPNRPIKHLLRR